MIPNQKIYDISASVLDVDKFDEKLFKAQIQCITVFNDNKLVFRFYDGREETHTWQDPSRRDSWTPEMKERAAQYARRRSTNE